MEICIAKNTVNCMPHVRKNIEATYMDLKTIARGLCSSKRRTGSEDRDNDHCLADMQMESTMCSVPDALYCLNSLHTRMLQTVDKESVCR